MPRVIRDSDEEVETKSSTRRTRASSAASSVSITDSPARRTTRSNKQLAIIESSPESLDDSNTQPRVRATRSRTTTLDKSATAAIAKSTRSRKNSASSNLSETIDLESETTQKRVTRKAAATVAAVGTPTKANLRSRNLRAGSEVKSTPPTTTRSTRVTRASSVDPINTANESVGTPVKRRTRASIVPPQKTVKEEEEEAQTETPESLDITVVEIDQDSETESVSTKGKSNKKVTKNKKEIVKDSSSTDQSNLDTSKTNEENMTDKSCTSNDSTEDSTLKALTTHSVTSKLETFKKKENSEKIDQIAISSESLISSTDQKFIESDESHLNSNENNCASVKSRVDVNDDEYEHVDVENLTLTDDSIDVVNSPKKFDTKDTLLDIKDCFVKLNQTNLVEKIVSEKLEENNNKDNNNLSEKLNDGDNVSQNVVMTNAKTAIVLVNDFVKSNEYFDRKEDQQIFDSGISLNNREDKNSNNSVHNSDDQLSIVSIDDNDEVLSLKLLSPNEKETQNDELIVQVLPDDEKTYFDEVTDASVSMNVNNIIINNFSSLKSDICLKENASESKLKSENLVGEKNNKLGSLGALNVVHNNVVEIVDEIGDELLSEKTSKLDYFKMLNASGGNVTISNSLHVNVQHGDSVSMDVDDDAIVSVNVKSSIGDADLVATESKNNETKNESSEIESACEFSNASSNVGSGGNVIIEKNDSVSVNSIKAEQSNIVTDTNEQLELTDPPSSKSNSNENRDIANPCVFNETSSNEIESKLSLEDKNAVPYAVTDADGDNASSPVKEEEKQHETSTDTTSTKSPEKSKRKSRARVIDSDLDESAENLFQDIPAEEWSEEQSKRKSNEYKRTNEIGNSSVKLDEDSFSKDKSVLENSVNGEDDGSKSNKKSRKSFNDNELDKSLVEITNVANETGNQEADLLSLSKRGRKSAEKKRESGHSSDSGIQDGNKTVVDNDAEENDHESNESSSKNRLSLNRSLKVNQSLSAQDKNDSIAEKLSKSLVDRKSLNTSRKSLNNSSQFNVSVFDNFRKKNDSLSTSLNASNASRKQSLSDTRKSIAEEKTDENSEAEAMDVDEAADGSESELNKSNDSSSRSRKSPSKNDSIAEKSSVSLNASKISKRLSLDKSLNKSSRKSSIQEEKTIDSEEVDSNKSTKEAANIKSLSKSQTFFNESPSQNDSLSENLPSTSLNESKKSKKRLSQKFNDSTSKSSLVKEQNEEEKSGDEEMEVDVVSDKSPNKSRKCLDEPSINKSLNKNEREAQVSLNNEDESPRGKSKRKSAIVFDDNSESEVEPNEDDEMKNKSTSKSPKTPTKFAIKASNVKDAETPQDSMTEGSPKKKKKGQEANSVPSVLDRSLQKSIELMKFANPSKHDISTVVQVNSDSEEDSYDSDNYQVPDFIFKLSDEDDTGEEEKEENDVDSDIEREYNLGCKSITKYSDDEVLGDDCRASEEESSDDEDDGADLQDFLIPDEEVEDVEDEDDDEDDDGDDDDDGGDEAEDDVDEDDDVDVDASEDEDAKVQVSKEKKINVSKTNLSVNSSQSTVKNESANLRKSGFFQSSGSESDDEATEAENKNGKECFDQSEKLMPQDSKTSKGKNTSLQKKHESIDKSSTKSHESSSSECDDKDIGNESQTKAKTDKSMNISVKNNKSLNSSKSNKDKSVTSASKRNSSKSALAPKDSKPDKRKSVRMKEDDKTESSSSESDRDYEAPSKVKRSKGMQIASPSETESESEEGEDYYRILNVESRDASLIKPKNKKLIDCSTPKPAAAKKTDFSKDNLSMTASRRKSGSLNDLSNSKVMSSRQSIGETASKSMRAGDTSMKLKDDVEIVATPDTVGKTRQAWKLIPLNQTAHPAVEDTPGTKFLKKAKLNDSFPVLESMKSGDLSSTTKKKSNGAAEHKQPAVEPEAAIKSKKRKLLDMSNAQSVDEDSILKVPKNKKKRARLDDSTMPAAAEQEEESESVEQSTKKKSKKVHGKQATGTEALEKVSKNKKNKKKEKSQANEAEVDGDAAEDEVEEKPTKKRKKKLLSAQEADEEGENAEPEKPRKSKSKVSEAKQVESQGSKSKKSKKQVVDSSGDEAPESLGLEEARRLAFNEMQQELEGARTAKLSLKKKRKDQAERVRQDKQTKSLKRLPEDVLDSLTEEPLRRPDKRQKLSRNKERSVTMPSKSMFSPGKVTPENLRVDDSYIPLSSTGGTTQFAVVNLRKAKKVVKKSAAALNFREKMLARNPRMSTAVYLSYLKKQKAKSSK